MTRDCPRCTYQNPSSEPFCVRCKYDIKLGEPNPERFGDYWFCGKSGPLSKEHIIPRWTYEIAGIQDKKIDHKITRLRDPFDNDSERILGSGRMSRKPYLRDKWAPVVCQTCNNGWMSKLQVQAKPIIKGFIEGNVPDLDQNDRHIIARWIAVTTSVGEYLCGPPVIWPTYRRWLMNGGISPHWPFSYARNGGEELNGTVQINRIRMGDNPVKMTGFFVSCWITLGSTVFHCLASSHAWDIYNCIGSYPKFQSRFGLRSLWPQMQEQPASMPGVLTFARVRRTQAAIAIGAYVPKRPFEPEDLAFLSPSGKS